MSQKIGGYFLFFFKMSERFRIENTCIILNLINGQAVQNKSDTFFPDPFAAEIDEIKILSGFIRARRGRGGYANEFTVVSTPFPDISPSPPPEPEAE
jgi:hypothetical protein